MKTIVSFIFIVASFFAMAQNTQQYLRLGNVQQSWYIEESSIDTLSIEVKRKGAFAEVGMIFDFSARGTSFSPGDSLEVQMFFDIPGNYEVSDMWLWIDDTIIKADVYDKWTASQIYEDIVDRRTDPAILYQTTVYDWWTGYTYSGFLFRIFPLLTDLPRKAKITFLIPLDAASTFGNSVNLPVDLPALSALPVQKANIKIFVDNPIDTPLVSILNPNFVYNNSVIGEEYFEADLTNFGFAQGLNVTFQSALPEISVGTFTDTTTGNNFYQLQLIPSKVFDLSTPTKATFLVDFVQSNCSSLTPNQVIDGLKNHILSYADELDSFNIMFSGMYTTIVSNSWMSADSLNVESVFSTISSSAINNYSNLQMLLLDGISFINDHNGEGSLVLISSGNSNTGYTQPNALMNNIFGAMNSPIKINVIDLDNIDVYSEQYYIGNTQYFGNEYLFENLAQISGADYYSLSLVPYLTMLSNITSAMSPTFNGFSCFTTIESGFTFSNYNVSNNSALMHVDEPICYVGKYTGSGRFNVILNAQLQNGQLIQLDTLIETSNVLQFDSVTRSVWAGQYIRDLYNYNQSNSLIQQIIDISRAERVLSDYTAFLALEPGQGPLYDEDGNIIGSVADNDIMVQLNIFPNPANDIANVTFELKSTDRVEIELLDLTGKRLMLLANKEFESGKSQITFSVAELPAGMYLIAIRSGSQSIVKKLAIAR